MGTRHARASGLAAAGSSVLRYGLVTTLVWIGAGPGGIPQLSVLGEALLKDTVLLGAALLTAVESLQAARTGNRRALEAVRVLRDSG
jgi:uncharacterized membrane protein YkgB